MNTKKLFNLLLVCLCCGIFTACTFEGDGTEDDPTAYENAITIDGTKYLIDSYNCTVSPTTDLKFVDNSTGTTVVVKKKGEALPTYIDNNLLDYNDWSIDVTEIKSNGTKILYHYENLNSYDLENGIKTYWTAPDVASIYMEDAEDYLTVKMNLDLGKFDKKGVVKLYCCMIKDY